ncbi:hypothetical protein B0H14DRAFT_3135416 [Mycena olivaceomarginata]|nr:hypothetical protein B0H14DRAFT_3135416 [Mycena olivaceomarginata]
MPLVKDLLASIVNYRLGYSSTRPYAWRWTTPVAFVFFLVATIILALINGVSCSPFFVKTIHHCFAVPLSAYTTVSEATFTPNASLPVLPLSGLVPSIFQESSDSGSFSPQTLTPGQIIRSNGSVVSYNIMGAYNGFNTSQPVTSFLYYNNPLSDSCDVTTMTIHTQSDQIQVSVQITCWTPTVYILSSDINSIFSPSDDIRIGSLTLFFNDLDIAWHNWQGYVSGTSGSPLPVPHGSIGNLTDFEITVRPCCDCHGNGDATWNTGVFSLDYPPCSDTPASFLSFGSAVYLGKGDKYLMSNNTDFFPADDLNTLDETSFVGLNTLLRNLFQAVYHSIRLDLGILQPNQIFKSPDMYTRSISTVYIPGVFFNGATVEAYANYSRQASSQLTNIWTAEQQDVVRVPFMSYIRPVPRLKPLGAAITSVFVSTFAMISVLWQVFSLIAAALSDKENGKSIHIIGNPLDNKEVESLKATVEQMRQAALLDKGNRKSILIIGSILRANSNHLDKKEVESLRATVEQMRQESILRANWSPLDNKEVESLRVTVEQIRRAALSDKENGKSIESILRTNSSPLDNKEVESLRATVEQMRRAALSDKGNGKSILIIGSILRANSSSLDKKEVESLRETVEQMRQALHKHGLIVADED